MEINRDNEYKKVLKKLRQIFKNVPEDKKQMVDDLLQDYAFLHVDNLILRKMIEEYGSVLIDPFDKTKQKQSEAAKQYQRNSNTKNMHTRTLLLMLRGQDAETEDALDKFLKGNKS